MKKIVLTLALAVCAFAANAQLVISANIGGNMTSGTINSTTHVTVVTDSTYSSEAPMDKASSFTGGLQIGYKFGKCQVGIVGGYTSSSTTTSALDPTCIPMIDNAYYGTKGEMTVKQASLKVAPYFRYDVVTTGDVSIFAQLDAFYIMSMDPTVSATAHYFSKVSYNDFAYDTSSTFVRPCNSTSLGVNITPGLNWQLTKNCGIDLFLDFLSLGFATTTTVMDNYTFNVVPGVGGSFEAGIANTVTTTTKTTEYGGAITGTPILTKLGQNNWVRVGFYFTF